jgi:hypothetical protein
VSTANDESGKKAPAPGALRPETREQVQKVLDKSLDDADVNMNSGYRTGDKGPHGEGRAVDINRIDGQKVSDAVDPGVSGEQRKRMRQHLEKIKTAAMENENVAAYLGPTGGFFRSSDGKIGRETNPSEDEAHRHHIHITIRQPIR